MATNRTEEEREIARVMERNDWTRQQAIRHLNGLDCKTLVTSERLRRQRGKVGPGPGCYGPMF